MTKIRGIKTKPTATKQQAPPQQRKTSVPPVVRAPPRPKVDMKAIEQVCGLTDPFCPQARLAKYPDDSSVETMTFTTRSAFTAGTDANGNSAAAFFPRPAGGYVLGGAVTIATTIVTPNLSFDAPAVAPLTGAVGFRVISAGLKLKSVAPPLTASGMVYIRSFASEVPSSYTAYDGASFSASQCREVPLSGCTDECIIFEHSSQMPQSFYPLASTNTLADWVPTGFKPITITVVGAPASSSILYIEFVMHLEYVFADDAALGLACTPPPPANSAVTHAAAKISSSSSTFAAKTMSSLGTAIRRKAEAYLMQLLSSSPYGRAAMAGYAAVEAAIS